ncbi:hypothetical protein DMH27_12610 [Raoultella planticola]|nr:hypothetical protein [Raoultella planticola]
MKKLTLGLIGNPNSGKTTLFNQLTGARQRVGNWAGSPSSAKKEPLPPLTTGHAGGPARHLFADDDLFTDLFR